MQTAARIGTARRMNGFTLVETMFVVTVAAIILSLGVPAMSEFVRDNRMTSASNDILAALYMARTEAIKRHAPAVMCFSANPTSTTPSCDGTGQQGWIVFVDDVDPATVTSTDNNGQLDAGEPIVVRHGPLDASITVRATPDGNAGYILYNAAGYKRENGLGEDFEALILCDRRGNSELYGPNHSTARGMLISNSGRPSITRSVSEITGLGNCQ